MKLVAGSRTLINGKEPQQNGWLFELAAALSPMLKHNVPTTRTELGMEFSAPTSGSEGLGPDSPEPEMGSYASTPCGRFLASSDAAR
jgi:hypothetical protein